MGGWVSECWKGTAHGGAGAEAGEAGADGGAGGVVDAAQAGVEAVVVLGALRIAVKPP